MENGVRLLLALLLAYGCAVAGALLHRRFPGRLGGFLGWGLAPLPLLCPLVIPSANVQLRAASAFASGDVVFKMVEHLRHARGGRGMGLREFLRFLVPFPVFAVVHPGHKRRSPRPESRWPQVLRVLGGIVGVGVALQAIGGLSRLGPVRSSFALNHVVMLSTFVLAVESLSRALCGLERLAGFDTTPIVRNAYLSRSVFEFWRRYNHRVHDWFHRNVFLPAGGRRAPIRSVLLVFLISGVFHEAAFAVATSRLTGYQFVFFSIQGPAALVSGRLERLAGRGGIAGRIATHGATILFLSVASVLFFDGVARIFPFFYVAPSPLR